MHLETKGVRFGFGGVLLARLLGCFACLLLLFALFLLLAGLDVAPQQFHCVGAGLQHVERVVAHIGNDTLQGILDTLGWHFKPQSNGVLALGHILPHNTIRGDIVEGEALNFGIGCTKAQDNLILQGTLRSGHILTLEVLVHKQTQIDLRVGRRVMTQRINPIGKARKILRIDILVEEAHLIDTRLIGSVLVLILHSIDLVVDRFEVLRHKDSVILGAGNGVGLVFEQDGVVFGDSVAQRVVEEQQCLACAIATLTVGNVARHNHRVDALARREYIAQAIEDVTLVVVPDGATEVERIGLVLLQRVVGDAHLHTTSTDGECRFLGHCGRHKEFGAHLLDLDILVKLDKDFLLFEVGLTLQRQHRSNHGRK